MNGKGRILETTNFPGKIQVPRQQPIISTNDVDVAMPPGVGFFNEAMRPSMFIPKKMLKWKETKIYNLYNFTLHNPQTIMPNQRFQQKGTKRSLTFRIGETCSFHAWLLQNAHPRMRDTPASCCATGWQKIPPNTHHAASHAHAVPWYRSPEESFGSVAVEARNLEIYYEISWNMDEY